MLFIYSFELKVYYFTFCNKNVINIQVKRFEQRKNLNFIYRIQIS